MAFTHRQTQILGLAARGLSDKEIAHDLGLSVHTVRSHLQRLYQNHGLSNRAEAVASFVEERSDPADAAQSPPLPDGGPLKGRALAAGALAGAGLALAAAGLYAISPTATAALKPAPAGHLGAVATTAAGGPASTPSPTPAALAPAATSPPLVPSGSRPAASPPAVPPAPPALTAPIQTLAGNSQLSLINQERSAAALPPLAWNQCLAAVAATQSRRLAEQGYVSTADGAANAAGCHLGLTPPAEILAYWPGVSDSQINQMLAANPADRALLMGPYRNLGAYWAVSPGGVAFLALEFA